MICIGSMGDVRPYLVLGRELKRRGHDITICAFKSFCKAALRENLKFKPISGDVNTFMSDIMSPGANGVGYLRQVRKTMISIIEPFLHDLEEAADGTEAVIATFFGQVFRSIAELKHVPYIQTQYFPMDKNPYTPIASTRGLHGGGMWNSATYQLGYLFISMLERHYLSDWREARGLPPRRLMTQPDYVLDGHAIPVLYAISPHVLPRPATWADNIYMTGPWLDDRLSGYSPSHELIKFIDSGEPPVYIGFGSMTGNGAAKALRAARDAVRSSGVRAILSVSGVKTDIKSERDLLVVGFIPHDWLFRRVRAVVHHGGAGTSLAGLEAGKPSLVVPFGGDQLFWGERIYELGVGPKPIPRERLTATKLSRALKKLVSNPAYGEAARELGARLRGERGVTAAADIIEAELSDWLGRDIRERCEADIVEGGSL